MLAVFLLCRGPVKRSIEWCKECCACGRDDDDEEEEDDDDDDEEGACANMCSCCTKDSDYDFDDSDDEADKKKAAAKSMSAASARTKGNVIHPLLFQSFHVVTFQSTNLCSATIYPILPYPDLHYPILS